MIQSGIGKDYIHTVNTAVMLMSDQWPWGSLRRGETALTKPWTRGRRTHDTDQGHE